MKLHDEIDEAKFYNRHEGEAGAQSWINPKMDSSWKIFRRGWDISLVQFLIVYAYVANEELVKRNKNCKKKCKELTKTVTWENKVFIQRTNFEKHKKILINLYKFLCFINFNFRTIKKIKKQKKIFVKMKLRSYFYSWSKNMKPKMKIFNFWISKISWRVEWNNL